MTVNGDVYKGNWKDDMQNGPGTLTYSDGSRFEGSFLDGQKHGKGKYMDKYGKIETQIWECGKEM